MRIQRLQRQYDAMEQKKAALIRLVNGLDASRLTERRSPEELSILETLEHLVESEEEALRQAAEWERTPKTRGVWTPVTLTFLCLVLRFDRRIPFSPPLEHPVPEATASLAEILRRWEEARAALQEQLERRSPTERRQTTYRHPVAGDLDVGQSLTLALAHLGFHGRTVRTRRDSARPKRK